MNDIVAENPGIGLYSERGLHSSLKKIYASQKGARVEVAFAGKVIDVVLPEEFVEIQTKNIGKITEKVLTLACEGHVRIVHPIVIKNTINKISQSDGEIISTRTARTGKNILNFFDELVHATLLVCSPNVSFDVVLVSTSEVRVKDGKNSWRGKKDKVISRDLISIEETIKFDCKNDWLKLIPKNLQMPCTVKTFAKAKNINRNQAQKILYVFSKARLFKNSGKNGREKLYDYEIFI